MFSVVLVRIVVQRINVLLTLHDAFGKQAVDDQFEFYRCYY